MKWSRTRFAGWALVLGLASRASAQVPVGDGLEAVYYAGIKFEHPLVRHREATVYDQWSPSGPLPGVPAEFFSVRWRGWLVPPVSGRYGLHLTVDDGMRVWLNDRLVVDGWGIQRATRYSAAVQLRAGQPYKLRVDYFQTVIDTRARLTWEMPPVPEPASWHNAWGLRPPAPVETAIPTRYLFTRLPGLPAAAPRPAITPRAIPVRSTAAVSLPIQPARAARPIGRAVASHLVPAHTHRIPHTPNRVVLSDSVDGRRVALLRAGRAVALPELRFDQGQVTLLPTARAALDELATALQAQPAWRLEVQGHTDNQGDAELNRQLSQRRAEAVCFYLEAHGVAAARLRPVGYGGTRPVADNQDPLQRPRNRRVVLARW